MEESNRLNFEGRTCEQTRIQQNSGDLLLCQGTGDSTSPAKYRRYGARLSGVKVHHKRQALQDMARPLKHWLYKHRDNPYPTKTEKILLALGSHMTLVQVSNWFANARRRLKNTVRQPDLSWALRIKLYNKYIQGNAERLSVSSDDSNSEDEECQQPTAICPLGFSRSSCRSGLLQKPAAEPARADSAHSDDSSASPPSKYKSSLLNRYLNDSLRHVMTAAAAELPADRKRRSHSESFSSIECEEDVASPACSSETENNFVYRMDTADYTAAKCDNGRGLPIRQAQEWREIHAAVALTSLSHGQTCTRGPSDATVESCSGGQTTAMGAHPLKGPTLASCIIQKSSHISEIKTVTLVQASSGI